MYFSVYLNIKKITLNIFIGLCGYDYTTKTKYRYFKIENNCYYKGVENYEKYIC